MSAIAEIRPGQSIELLKELHILTRDRLEACKERNAHLLASARSEAHSLYRQLPDRDTLVVIAWAGDELIGAATATPLTGWLGAPCHLCAD